MKIQIAFRVNGIHFLSFIHLLYMQQWKYPYHKTVTSINCNSCFVVLFCFLLFAYLFLFVCLFVCLFLFCFVVVDAVVVVFSSKIGKSENGTDSLIWKREGPLVISMNENQPKEGRKIFYFSALLAGTKIMS